MMALVRNELHFLFRQPLFWLACILVPAVGYLFTTGLSADAPSFGIQVQLKYVALVMLILPVYMGGLLPAVLLREQTSSMTELISATPTTFFRRELAKTLSFVICTWFLFALTFFAIGLIAVDVMASSSDLESNVLIPSSVNMMELFIDWLCFVTLILLPTILVYAACGLWMSKWQSSVFSFYAFALVVMVGYLVLASLTGSPILAGSAIASDALYQSMMWLDPFGFTSLFAGFTGAGEDHQTVGIGSDVKFVINRFVVFGATLAIIWKALVWQRLDLKVRHLKELQTAPKIQSQARVAQLLNALMSPLNRRKQTNHINFESESGSPLQVLFKQIFSSVGRHKVTLLILLAWPFLIFNEVLSGLAYVEPFSEKATDSLDAVNRINSDVLPVFGSLLMALWSWQITGLFISHQSHELIATTPIKNKTLLASQIAVIVALVMMLSGLTALGCLAAELVAGSHIIGSVYLIEFSRVGLNLVLLGVLFVSLQNIIRSRMLGSALVVTLLVFKFTPISGSLGMTHTLWNIAGTPLQQSDHFWGSAGSFSVFAPYMAVWLLVVSFFVVLATALSHRGTFFGSFQRVSLKQFNINGLAKHWTASLLAVLSLLAIIRLDQQLVIEKPLTYSHHREAWKAEYEHTYRHWLNKPTPVVEHLDAKIKIEPNSGFGQFELRYLLRNKDQEDINSFLVGRYGNFEAPSLYVEPNGKGGGSVQRGLAVHRSISAVIEPGQVSGQSIVRLAQPLKANQTLTLVAKFTLEQPKLWPVTSQFYIKPEMTYVRGVPLLPVIGFQPDWMLRNQQLRTQYQLPAMANLMPSERFSSRPYQLEWQRELAYEWTTYSSQIEVPTGYQAIGPGKLTHTESTGGETTYFFDSAQPMRQLPSWFVVPVTATNANQIEWQITKQQVGNVVTEVYVPNTKHVTELQQKNAVAINQLGMADTLKWLSKQVKPYLHSQLRMFAIPNNGPTGFAMPQTMLIGYEVGFMAQPTKEAGFDQRYRRAVHETAHQWFGHDIGNGISEDGAFLVESLAKYVELVMIEQRYGNEAKNALVEYERRRFENQQRFYYGSARGLVDATSPHQQYSQATLVFDVLRTELGDDVIVGALKQLWVEHGYPNEPATSMDFVTALKSVAGEAHHRVIEQELLGAPYAN